MTKEYIEREKLHKTVLSAYITAERFGFELSKDVVLLAIKQQPTADVVPVRRGTWIKADEQPYFRKHYHAKVCSECGKRKDGKWLYCPYCGSKNQDGGRDE